MRLKSWVLLFMVMVSLSAFTQESANTTEPSMDDLLSMSLEELLNLEVSVGNIAGSKSMDLPLSVTTITSEQIELSGAKNLLDLINIYVPGATFWRAQTAPLVGMRGIISDRNVKMLLILNGILLNQKAHGGVVTELENWEMEDFEKVEIIRGPGSVTYGSGAIAGVINITTKSAGSIDGLKVMANYVSEYNSKGLSASYGYTKSKNVKAYVHASIAGTEGTTTNGLIFDGDSIYPRPAEQVPTYMRDFQDEPQIKLLASLNLFENNTITARYNKSGTTFGYQWPKQQYYEGIDTSNNYIRSEYTDFSQRQNQQLLVSYKNTHKFSPLNIKLESELAYLSSDYTRTGNPLGFNNNNKEKADYLFLDSIKKLNSLDHPINLALNYAENSLIAKAMAVYQMSEKHKLALGIEYVNTHYTKGWGDDARSFRMGDNQEFLNGTDSWAQYTRSSFKLGTVDTLNGVLGEDYFYVGDGWSTNDLGIVGEVNLAFHPLFNLIVSGRLDKNTYSDFLVSPRLAIVSKINPYNTLKLILQESNRINTATQLYRTELTGGDKSVETIQNIELIYTSLIHSNMLLNVSGYYNKQNSVGWNNTIRKTEENATLSMAGFEIDYSVQTDEFKAGINHAFVKLLDYKLKEGNYNTFISFAEYYDKNDTLLANNLGSGMNLRNISNNTTKLYANKYFLDKRIAVHTDLAIQWGFEGSKDMRGVVTNPNGTESEIEQLDSLFNVAFNEKGFYGTSIFWNAAITAKVYKGLSLKCSVNNILGGDFAKIYHQGNVNTSGLFSATNYFVEPRSYEIKLIYKL